MNLISREKLVTTAAMFGYTLKFNDAGEVLLLTVTDPKSGLPPIKGGGRLFGEFQPYGIVAEGLGTLTYMEMQEHIQNLQKGIYVARNLTMMMREHYKNQG